MKEYTVVVTGATRGIGRAVARTFAAEGAHVVCCGRDADALAELATDLDGLEGDVTTHRADVRDEFDVEFLMETAARITGDIDLVVANAGVYHGDPGHTPLAEESYAAFDDHLRTNARGVFTTVVEALPYLAPEARILVPSGSVAREFKPGYGTYAISKSTAEALVHGFAAELDHPIGIVDPGVVETDLTGTGRDPADVAPMFRWVALECPPEDLNGQVVDLTVWKQATR
ncbi:MULTISPECIES: SDR family oxidoreductase [unclassified Haladaptatus]|uniref:SDR family oxidoreductase n=1 Tax=unclassified Haladaptatus TaxID=2622732 RepID=UPI0023E7CE44|nr:MULTISPECIES: SDR family oxidoreductase [unclassified Haladaptatus]